MKTLSIVLQPWEVVRAINSAATGFREWPFYWFSSHHSRQLAYAKAR